MDFIRPELIPDPTVRRMSLYLRQLEVFRTDGRVTVSSKQLGESLGLTDAQVRKDLTYFGSFGQPGVGYSVDEIITRIRRVLGTDKTWNAILVGAGNLGRALLSYGGFEAKGMPIVAVFDASENKVGATIAGRTVHAMNELKSVCDAMHAKLAILAVPAEAAQEVAAQLAPAGIKGVLNFSPARLSLPPTVALQSVDLAMQLEQVTFQVSLNAMTRAGVRHP